MQLYSISIREIENDLINFFRGQFPADTAPIFPGSDVRRRYRYTPQAWAELADLLSRQRWMLQIGVVLIQNDMRSLSTIEHLALLIWKLMRHVVAPHAPMNVTPLSTLMHSSNLAPSSAAVPAKAKRTPPAKKAKKAKRVRKTG